MSGLGGNRAVLMERAMAWSIAHDGDGTRLLLVAAGGSSPARLGEMGLGCPPLPCPPDAKLTEWMCREPGAAGWPRRGAS